MRQTLRIDAHQHFWRYDAADYDWIEPGSVLCRDHLPQHLHAELAARGLDGCVAVQARQTEAETRWLLDLARADPRILGVVGWIDLRAPDLERRLDAYADEPALKGFRHVVQAEPDGFLAQPAFIRGVRAVLARGYAYDILIQARQAPQVPAFLDQVGEGRLILDHLAKPDIARGQWSPWAEDLAAIARYDHVVCKVSGLVTEADHATWTPAQLTPYLDHALAAFGPQRLLYGSDWPVCRLAGDYPTVHDLVAEWAARACPEHLGQLFGGAARAAYGLE
jgi:L-fuconolactonase